MKEDYFYWKKKLLEFFRNIIIPALLLYIVGFLIVFAVNTWRFKPIAYLISFLICFGISMFLYFRKKEVINELKPDE